MYELKEIRANSTPIQSHKFEVASSVSIDDLANSWLKFLDVVPKTFETYQMAVKQFLKWISENGIYRPDRNNVIQYRENLEATGHKPTTINIYIMALKQFFKWTYENGLYPNITEHVKGKKIDQQAFIKDWLRPNQCKRLLSSIDRSSEKGLRDYALISLMLTTGLRTKEVAKADIQDLRYRGETLVLYIEGKGKEDKNAFVKIAAPVENALQDYLNIRTDKEPCSPLFSGAGNRSRGKRLTVQSVSRIAKTSLRNAGFDREDLTAHSFRHTAGHMAVNAGTDIKDVQQMLRHTNINTTMIYLKDKTRDNNDTEYTIASKIFE